MKFCLTASSFLPAFWATAPLNPALARAIAGKNPVTSYTSQTYGTMSQLSPTNQRRLHPTLPSPVSMALTIIWTLEANKNKH